MSKKEDILWGETPPFPFSQSNPWDPALVGWPRCTVPAAGLEVSAGWAPPSPAPGLQGRAATRTPLLGTGSQAAALSGPAVSPPGAAA